MHIVGFLMQWLIFKLSLFVMLYHIFFRPVKDVIILWYKIDGQGRTLLSDSTEYAINYLNRTLFILSPGTGDNGVYECEARVSGLDTVVTARASLTVYGKIHYLFCCLEARLN